MSSAIAKWKRLADAAGLPSLKPPRPDGPRRVIEVISESDILLKVGEGDGALDIKVSSVILKTTSEVFKKMLESQFIEGVSRIVELKEDNPQAILDFCRIIHHRTDSITDVDARRLRGLMVVADMR